MKPSRLLASCLCTALLGCSHFDTVDNRDHAIDVYYPNPNEIQLAQNRVSRYRQNNPARLPQATRYLAVSATRVLSYEIQDLWPKLINSETTASFFAHGRKLTYSNLDAYCIMIYDTAANRFVSDRGFVTVDLPPRGSVARWDGYMARYIGSGS
ncbi:MAG: hypothetical protein JO015_20570 [Verrucomicrobia bacterium]|nr:hypothetical protein [Verrucomicrobiota bacterium]